MKNYGSLFADSLRGTLPWLVWKKRRPRFPASAATMIQTRCGEQGPEPVARRLNPTPRRGTDRPTDQASE